jgi:curved DNA-binding protein CbpA
MDEKKFVDYYELMQISPNAEMETIQRVYRMLAARYHPDNPETADADHFMLLNEAYGVLSEPDARSSYDLTYQTGRTSPMEIFNLKEFAIGISGENHRRMGILCLLYNRRRTDPDKPGMSLLEFEKVMSFPREHLIFTIWYLQSKGMLKQGERFRHFRGRSGLHRAAPALQPDPLQASQVGGDGLGAFRRHERGGAGGPASVVQLLPGVHSRWAIASKIAVTAMMTPWGVLSAPGWCRSTCGWFL